MVERLGSVRAVVGLLLVRLLDALVQHLPRGSRVDAPKLERRVGQVPQHVVLEELQV